MTPLHLSASLGHLSIIDYLVNHGANVNVKDKKHLTPLHLSAHNGHYRIIEYLINHGADVNSKDIYFGNS